jgi:hypothetical protein
MNQVPEFPGNANLGHGYRLDDLQLRCDLRVLMKNPLVDSHRWIAA